MRKVDPLVRLNGPEGHNSVEPLYNGHFATLIDIKVVCYIKVIPHA
jgi:hypothetical protein